MVPRHATDLCPPPPSMLVSVCHSLSLTCQTIITDGRNDNDVQSPDTQCGGRRDLCLPRVCTVFTSLTPRSAALSWSGSEFTATRGAVLPGLTARTRRLMKPVVVVEAKPLPPPPPKQTPTSPSLYPSIHRVNQ